jgi:3-oxoacyl-(acyl-carrier-protein) synthase
MSLGIAGMSWVTPLGSNVDEVWQRLLAGEKAPVEILDNEQSGARYLVCRVPTNTPFPAHPRLRRASAISRFAAAAGLAALAQAKPAPPLDRIAVVFAISNGGVIYTRRFYTDIVKSGAQAASPLLFPETVFNAPASHLAAILGINGASYTVVGDGAVGILALKLAEDLLASDDLDFCLVVGAEEIDPLVCEAYRQWRFLRNPNKTTGRGMIMGEGAGAILLERSNPESVSALEAVESATTIERIAPGANFFRRAEAAARLGSVVARLENGIGFGIGSANGTFIDRAERAALGDEMPLYSPKISLGESVGASVLWQVIAAAQALKTGTLPGASNLPADPRALVLACGLNQQTGGLTLRGSEQRKR